MMEDKNKRRIALRGDLEKSQNEFKETAKSRGISKKSFWDLIGLGNLALFKTDYKKKYNISDDANLDDHLHPILITGKSIAIDTTNQQAESFNLGKDEIIKKHIENNKAIRELLKQNTGFNPEDIPPLEDIKNIKNRKKLE
jgi:hypothetical protein